MDRRPDRATDRASGRGQGGGHAACGLVDDLAEGTHVLDGDDDLDVEFLAGAGVDDGDRAGGTAVAAAAEEPGDLIQGALGGGGRFVGVSGR